MNDMTKQAKELSKVAKLDCKIAERANVIAERTNDVALGMTKALMIENLKEKLRNGVAHFFFVKKDGTLREAWGTTQKELAGSKVNGRGESRENFACCAFWDIEKGAWRSFRWETLVQVI